MKHRIHIAALSAAFLSAAQPALACMEGGGASEIARREFTLAFRPDPSPITVGDPFALELMLCGKPGHPTPEVLAVDAWMPDHRHGMNLKPVINETAPGRYRVEGLLFHMPGRWEFRFELQGVDGRERLAAPHLLD